MPTVSTYWLINDYREEGRSVQLAKITVRGGGGQRLEDSYFGSVDEARAAIPAEAKRDGGPPQPGDENPHFIERWEWTTFV